MGLDIIWRSAAGVELGVFHDTEDTFVRSVIAIFPSGSMQRSVGSTSTGPHQCLPSRQSQKKSKDFGMKPRTPGSVKHLAACSASSDAPRIMQARTSSSSETERAVADPKRDEPRASRAENRQVARRA